MIHFFPSRPVFVELFGFSVHWYGLLYLCAFLLAWVLLPRLQRLRGLDLSKEEWSSLLSWIIVGVIGGGRLGYVLLYEPMYFLQHPLEIFAVWHGGMSSHGGFIGVTLALLWALRGRKRELWHFADIFVIPVALGLALGRVGNFINQELYGTVTTVPWCILIPGVEGCRHPAQLYAVAKDLFIAGCCYLYLINAKPLRPGRTAALFLMLYGALRFLIEFVREPDHSYYFITRGQWYSLPIVIAGIVLWQFLGKRKEKR